MKLRDRIITGETRVIVLKKKGDKIVDVYDLGSNEIQFRAKYIFSRLLGGGKGFGNFEFGDNASNSLLKVTALAIGNGGHLIYYKNNNTSDVHNEPSWISSNALDTNSLVLLNNANNGYSKQRDTSLPAMPVKVDQNGQIIIGYNNIPNNPNPGATYEPVFNGNVPWDGVTPADSYDNGLNHRDSNSINSPEAGITLFSETCRIPLDPQDNANGANSGIVYANKFEVTFKFTLPEGLLNSTNEFGYANEPLNIISEVGLITGWVPRNSNGAPITNFQDNQNGYPQVENFPYTSDGKYPNIGSQLANVASKIKNLHNNEDTAELVNFIPDTFNQNEYNRWNLLSRKTFGALIKQQGFSFVFLWTIAF